MTTYYNGYDLSTCQGIITQSHWEQIANSNIKFIINRCGIGNNGIDYLCKTNIANAKAVGILTAIYHFVFPLPVIQSQPLRDPVRQAQYHFSNANGEIAFMDFEYPTQDQWSKWGCSANQINDWGLKYLETYSQLSGRTMGIYTFPWFCQTVSPAQQYANYPLWIASYQQNYPTIPMPWKSYCIWQQSGGNGAHLPSGVPVDLDLASDLSIFGAQAQNNQAPQILSTQSGSYAQPMGGAVQPMSMPVQTPPQMPIPAPQMGQGTISGEGMPISGSSPAVSDPNLIKIEQESSNIWKVANNVFGGIGNIFKK